MTSKSFSILATAGLLMLAGQQARAHVSYGNLGTLINMGDTATLSGNDFGRFGWLAGTAPELGDSHHVGNASGFFSFTLTHNTSVQISVTAASALMNPAFSVYSGLLPLQSHDYDANDPVSPYDAFAVLHTASTKDMRPDDPMIPHYVPVGYAADGEPLMDPVHGYALLQENPIWNTPDPDGIDLGGLTPAQWYDANYQAHDGYRDTLNFTTVGGYKFDAGFGWVPANFNFDTGLFEGFNGQFDAFGDWSMSNSNGEWSKIDYISSVSSTACEGPNCITTDTGGFINPGHFAGNDGLTEILTLSLGPGHYTIAVDGESCNDLTVECGNALMSASVTATVVPLPGAVWLLLSGLAGIAGLNMSGRRATLLA